MLRPPWRVIAVTLLAAALSACVNYRGIHGDSHPAAVTDYPSAVSIPVQGGTWPAMDWSAQFGDPQLGALIGEAVASSPTLAEARARVAKATAYTEQARAATGPSADVKYAFTHEHFSGSTYFPPPIGNSWQNENALTFGASYDLDLWGKNHEALRSAISERKAAEAEAQQARLVLSTSVAHAYVHLALLYALRDVAQNEVTSRRSIGALTQQRVRTGLDNEVESRTVDVTIDATQTDISELDGQIAVTRYQLAALLGKGPDRGLQIARPVLLDAADNALPASLPADLLSRRPDIVAAHWRIDASGHDVKVAKADFFPDINLAAVAGYDAFGWGHLFSASSRQVQAGPAIHLPLFDGGALRAQLKDRYAGYDTAVDAYNQTLIAALNDVATQVASLHAIEQQQTTAQHAYDASRRAYDLEIVRYKAGLDPQLQVLSSDVARLQQSQRVATLRMQRLDAQIALIQALGGGYAAPKPAGTDRVASAP
ncbi:efflux transporter outer membrane subunit [Dyella acidiphila]|uniref:Efflux transporter outer membrane subunit n=1 Tax=Dyella acidiphila TaxID=2775866 RepID=A0ABR9G9W2_9GAMM|nr:efflux transporter outer membrane subunit [Dyella acidiphila]MBE1160841.1 efflux transporter outer membrane subunit [Dyella acidiphila]